MRVAQIVSLIKDTRLSPEQVTPALGVSNMTLRRLLKKPRTKVIPSRHERAFVAGIYQLVIEGRLSLASKTVQSILKAAPAVTFLAFLKELGVSSGGSASPSCHEECVLTELSRLGAEPTRQKEVEEAAAKLESLKAFGPHWKSQITSLQKIAHLERLPIKERWIAYGALYYLILPFDLIPKDLPMIGFVDAFGMLSFASAHYEDLKP